LSKFWGKAYDISADPLFFSTTDFHLQENSPARGAADDGSDIGAFGYADVGAPKVPIGIIIY